MSNFIIADRKTDYLLPPSLDLKELFVQVLELAHEMKLLKLGAICLDGTKLHANASRHSALSHGHIEKREVPLKAEVQELLALAEQADRADSWGYATVPSSVRSSPMYSTATASRLRTGVMYQYTSQSLFRRSTEPLIWHRTRGSRANRQKPHIIGRSSNPCCDSCFSPPWRLPHGLQRGNGCSLPLAEADSPSHR